MATRTNKPNEAAEAAAEAVTESAGAAAEPVKESLHDVVELYISPPVSENEDPNVVIYVNGRNWVMAKGASYNVPRYVANEYRRGQKAHVAALNNKRRRAQREQAINARAAALIGGKTI